MFKFGCFLTALIMLFACVGCSPSGELNPPVRTPYVDESAYSDTDHIFEYNTVSWNGPEGYVIIVPENDEKAMSSAELLRLIIPK